MNSVNIIQSVLTINKIVVVFVEISAAMPNKDMSDITKLDLYVVLEVSPDATNQEIVRAYRKKALKCHPDKNPDNPRAAEMFHQLFQALEVLSDELARAAYDKVLKAKKAHEIRHRQLDAKRKKFKEDLESRETAARSENEKKEVAKEKLLVEVERLRKEGSSLLEREQELLRDQLKRESTSKSSPMVGEEEVPRLKIKWKSSKNDPSNGGYNETVLHEMFSKYGKVNMVLVSSKRNGSAIVEFCSADSAEMAVKRECGLRDNPISSSWIGERPSRVSSEIPMNGPSRRAPDPVPVSVDGSVSGSDRDFESIVLMKLRQAEERKRLADQIEAEEK